MKKIKHFAIGVVASVIPVVPAIVASSAVQDFIGSHPAYAFYFPILSGVVVAAFHKLWPTYKAQPVPIHLTVPTSASVNTPAEVSVSPPSEKS